MSEGTFSETTWLWVACIGMALGSIVLLVQIGRRTAGEEAHGVIHALVPMIAAALYLLMAVGQGAVTLAGGREFLFGRYIDWAMTTPLLLVGLALTALGDLRKRLGLVLALVGADIYMIMTGLAAGYSPSGSGVKWLWYVVSCGAFLGVYWVLWGPLRAEARLSGMTSVYTRNTLVLSVLWLVYPVIFVFGTDGLGIVGAGVTALGFAVVDLLAKVGFGLLASAEPGHLSKGAGEEQRLVQA